VVDTAERPETAAVAPPAGPPPPRLARTFESLALRDFRLLWGSTVLSGFGQWGQQISLNWLVYVLTGSATQLGGVSFAAGIMTLWITPFAGVLADRLPRRTILWTSSLFGAATAAAVALLIVTDLIEVWHAYAFALITGVAQAVNQPARQAAVYDTATPDTLQNAVALNSLAQNLARIVGPAAAGVIAVWSLTAAFLLVALMRAFAALATYLMAHRPAPQRAGARRNPLADVLEGFRYLASDARLAGLWLVNSLPSLIVYPYVALLPIFAEEVFNAGSRGYGVIVTMVGIGSAIGLIILAIATNLRRRGVLMMTGFLLYLVAVLAFTQTDRLAVALPLLIAGGVVHGFALALNTYLFQTSLRDDMRGRGMAAWQLGFSLMPIGALPIGILVDHLGPNKVSPSPSRSAS
jgi:predicted MFS family arabinose efflux permease